MHQVLVCSDSLSTAWHAAQGIAASPADGVHLDADQHERLGNALAALVGTLPGFALSS